MTSVTARLNILGRVCVGVPYPASDKVGHIMENGGSIHTTGGLAAPRGEDIPERPKQAAVMFGGADRTLNAIPVVLATFQCGGHQLIRFEARGGANSHQINSLACSSAQRQELNSSHLRHANKSQQKAAPVMTHWGGLTG